MNLTNFSKFRIGDHDIFADVRAVGHSSELFFVEGYTRLTNRLEVREKNGSVAMFLFKYEDAELPDYWKDSTLIFIHVNPDAE